MKKILVVPLILGIGIVGYWQFTQQSKTAPTTLFGLPTASPNENVMVHSIDVKDEQTFIQEMIPHHQEAIDTSKMVLAETKDLELKKFATDVINVQSGEVVLMKTWLLDWFGQKYMTNSNYLPMMGDLSKFNGQQLDKMYVVGMIRHHQGAIEMAKKVVTLNPRSEILAMANDIITVQQAEVDLLQSWLDTKYSGVEAQDDMQHEMNIH